MNIRAKMYVQSITTTEYSDVVELCAVYGGTTNAEDNTYAKASPSGTLKLQIDNPTARGIFKPGMKYYVDLSPVPPEKV